MNFTFGIVTNGSNDIFLQEIINSILLQEIPCFEIIIVGNTRIQHSNVRCIPFDETKKPAGWITRKKNMICQEAKYDNIVLLHDYIRLSNDWYKGFLTFGNNFQICTTKIQYMNGKRARDFSLFTFELPPLFQDGALFPYGYKPNVFINKLMYISGAYYIIKKETALQYPLNEDLYWGTGEDVELSQRLTDNNILLQCNEYSTVQFMKYKAPESWEHEIKIYNLVSLETMDPSLLELYSKKQRIYLKNTLYNSFHLQIYPHLKQAL